MSEPYDVVIKVISQQGHCSQGHQVGDQWTMNRKTPGGICTSAYSALDPTIQALVFGAAFPWAKDPDADTIACPDAKNPVIFEIRRVKKS